MNGNRCQASVMNYTGARECQLRLRFSKGVLLHHSHTGSAFKTDLSMMKTLTQISNGISSYTSAHTNTVHDYTIDAYRTDQAAMAAER
jgi:hypothetical protein